MMESMTQAHRSPGRRAVALAAPALVGLALAVVPGTGLAAQEPLPPPAEEGAAGEMVPARGADSLELVDAVAAIVGDTTILLSEIQQEMQRLQAQGARVPPPGTPERERLAREIINAMTDRILLLQEARRAGITVPDERLDAATEQLFQQRRANFGSDEEFQQAVEEAGLNMFQYRQELRAQARSEILLGEYRRQLQQEGRLPAASATDEEVRAYFEQNRSSDRRPATVTFSRLLIVPEPTPEADSAARAEAARALEELRAGEPFEVVARRYSDDPATREEGGELGWMRRDEVVPTFGDVAWSGAASRGTPIGPVKTRFGYHIIRVENTRGGERNLRHILVRPELGEEHVEEARRRAEALADSLRGGVPVDSVLDAPGVASDERDRRFEDVPLDRIAGQFGRPYREAIGRPEAGKVAGPFEVEGTAGLPEFVILRVEEYRPPGEWRLEDVEANIRDRLRTQKQLDLYLEELRQRAYVEILL